MNAFMIKAKMPSLNELIAANRQNRFRGAKFKKDVEEVIGWAILQAMRTGTLRKVKEPCTINFFWHESTKRRDADNIASAKKFILDALQKQGILENDNRKWVKGFTDTIIDDRNDFVVVEIVEKRKDK